MNSIVPFLDHLSQLHQLIVPDLLPAFKFIQQHQIRTILDESVRRLDGQLRRVDYTDILQILQRIVQEDAFEHLVTRVRLRSHLEHTKLQGRCQDELEMTKGAFADEAETFQIHERWYRVLPKENRCGRDHDAVVQG